jgi:LPS-assembly protein
VRQGTVTTCELPRPKWQFNAGAFGRRGRHRQNLQQRLPADGDAGFLFSLCDASGAETAAPERPADSEFRQLVHQGNIAGESVYWVFNRSMDATMGAEYYSKRGWSQRGEFRARPSDTSYVFFNYIGVVDRGIGNPPQDQGGEDARFLAERAFGTPSAASPMSII